MFVLRTGLQGNGKTLNTIKEVDQKAAAEGRTVYYCNVTGFNAGHAAIKAEWVQFDHPETWFTLPANAIIVIDEAQTWFRTRAQGSKVPDYASRLEIMRKDGHELHCITQSPKLIDAHMRELCNHHIHYHRGNGGKVIKRWVFQKPELTVNSNKLEFENGESTRITIDKTYFGCYESVKEGSEHHFKFRPPKAMLVLGACVLLLALGVSKIYYSRYAHSDVPEHVADPVVSEKRQGALANSSPVEQQQMTVAEYLASRTPRVSDVPSSAPRYDQLTQPVAFPKPFCVSSEDPAMLDRNRARMAIEDRNGRRVGCRCNSQQGSRLDVSFDFCLSVVENGYFDDTRPDSQPQRREAVAGRAGGTAQPDVRATGDQPTTRVVIIPDNSRAPRTLL